MSRLSSHESALDLLDLSYVIPDAVHLTLPLSRHNLSTVPGVRIGSTNRLLMLYGRPIERPAAGLAAT